SRSCGQRNGAEDGIRTRDPHLGKVMLYQLSHFRSGAAPRRDFGAESQSRTGDTAIFSRVLYQLSYLGPTVSVSPKRLAGAAGARRGPFSPSLGSGHRAGPAEVGLVPPDGRREGCLFLIAEADEHPRLDADRRALI